MPIYCIANKTRLNNINFESDSNRCNIISIYYITNLSTIYIRAVWNYIPQDTQITRTRYYFYYYFFFHAFDLVRVPLGARTLSFSKNEREETLSVFEEHLLRDVMHISKGSKYSRDCLVYIHFRSARLCSLFYTTYFTEMPS